MWECHAKDFRGDWRKHEKTEFPQEPSIESLFVKIRSRPGQILKENRCRRITQEGRGLKNLSDGLKRLGRIQKVHINMYQ